MVTFVIMAAIFFLIIANVSSHQSKEILQQENERNKTELLLAEIKIKEAEAFKNAIGVSKKIVNWNDTFIIDSFNTDSIRMSSLGISEIRLGLVWRMDGSKLNISIDIKSKDNKCQFSDRVFFYNKSESEIINELKIIFHEIQKKYHLKKFINLY